VAPTTPFNGLLELVIFQLVAGLLIGVFVWILLAPRSRIRRASVVLVTINWLAWLMFLAFTPRVSASEFEEIARTRRYQQTSPEGGIEIIYDGPSVLAGRESGFWAVNNAHRFLILMSGPAIAVAEGHVVPGILTTRPTRAESYWIAAIGFVLSTAWWATVGTAASWIHQVWKRRNQKRI
jgi:hypothetical protein